VISDKWQDAAAADYAGCTSMLVVSPWSVTGHHDFLLPSLSAIVDKILILERGLLPRIPEVIGERLTRLARSQLAKAAAL